MIVSFVILAAVLAVAGLLLRAGGWRRDANELNKTAERNRKAHEIQNDIAMGGDLRERVRRDFDRP